MEKTARQLGYIGAAIFVLTVLAVAWVAFRVIVVTLGVVLAVVFLVGFTSYCIKEFWECPTKDSKDH